MIMCTNQSSFCHIRAVVGLRSYLVPTYLVICPKSDLLVVTKFTFFTFNTMTACFFFLIYLHDLILKPH